MSEACSLYSRRQNRGTRTGKRQCIIAPVCRALRRRESFTASTAPPKLRRTLCNWEVCRLTTNDHGARFLGRRRCRLRACNHRNRVWKVSLYATDNMRANLHGHGHRRYDTFLRFARRTVRPGNGFHCKRMANGVSNVG